MEVYIECCKPNWDGYSADPVTQSHVHQARRILQSLPPEIPVPSLGAEPDGCVTMEWYQSTHQLLSVSVDDKGKLYYAALIDDESPHGTVQFTGQFPDVLVDLIRRVLPVAGATS